MRPLFFAAALLALAACDSGPAEDPARGRFEATFTGDVEASLEGAARISRQTFPDGTVLVGVTMVPSGSPTRSLSITGEDGDLSRTGSFALGGASGLGLVYIDVLGGSSALFSTSGEVTLTRADDDRVTGSFTATLEAFPEGDERAQVEGTFDATPGASIGF